MNRIHRMGQGLPCSKQSEAFRSDGRGLGRPGTWLLALWVALGPASAQVVDLSGEWRMEPVASSTESAGPPTARTLGQRVALPGFVTGEAGREVTGQARMATESRPDPESRRRSRSETYLAAVRTVDLRTPPAVPRGGVWLFREVEVPGWWQGDRVALCLESVSGETSVWVDGQSVGHRSPDRIATDLDLTGFLVPGRHHLALRVENRQDLTPAIGLEGAGNSWRGPCLAVLGRMELRASPKVRFGRVRVFPGNGPRSLRLEIPLENSLAGVGTAGMTVEAETPRDSRRHLEPIHRSEVTLGFGRTEVTVEVPIPGEVFEEAQGGAGYGRLRLALTGAVLDRGVQHETAVAFRVPRPSSGEGPTPGAESGASAQGQEWTVDPIAVPEAPPSGVRVVHRFDEFARSELERGRSVLLLADPHRRRRVPSPAAGVSWHAEHPVFRVVPSDASAVWHWRELLSGADWWLLEGFPAAESERSGRASGPPLGWTGSGANAGIRPLWLEARLGRGRLAIVSLDLETDLEQRPLTRDFRSRLLRYLGSGEFRPRTRVAPAALEGWLGPRRIRVGQEEKVHD